MMATLPAALATRFLSRETSAAENRTLAKMLLRRDDTQQESDLPAARRVSPSRYTAGLDHLQSRLAEMAQVAAQERERALRLADDLTSTTPERRRELLAGLDLPSTARLAEMLWERSLAQSPRDPERALLLARLAEAAVNALGADAPAERAADLRAQALAQVGNVLRVLGEFPAASEALRAAAADLTAGTGDPGAGAFVLARQAALLADQSRFEEALVATRKAGRLFRAAGREPDQCRSLVLEADVLSYLDRSTEAVQALDRAAGLLDRRREPRLALAITLNRASYLLSAGALAEARASLADAARLADALQNPLDSLRVAWVEGELLIEQSRLPEAESRLRSVREEFLRLALSHEVALVTLELALVVARQERLAEAGALALEALPVFEALRVHPEALASVRLALDAARGQAARVELLRSALRRLRR